MTTCPNCGSRFLRPARPVNRKESLNRFRFIDPLRCLDCKTRFVTKTLVWTDFLFAKCPGCRRMDLNSWTGNTFTPPWFWAWLKIAFGAHSWRCEYCRLNFASFRPRQETFRFNRWERLGFFKVAEPSAQKTELAQGEGGPDAKENPVGEKSRSATVG